MRCVRSLSDGGREEMFDLLRSRVFCPSSLGVAQMEMVTMERLKFSRHQTRNFQINKGSQAAGHAKAYGATKLMVH